MNAVRPEELGVSSLRLQRQRTAMQGYVARGQLAGLITLVVRRGQVAHFECTGMMDVEARKPMRPHTIFRIYSMTKPITSVALMMLFEEGRFLLDDPAYEFIPEFKDLKVFVKMGEAGVEVTDLERAVTIRHLLTHTSGLGYGLLADGPVEEMYQAEGLFGPLKLLQVSPPELVQRLTRLPLAYQPGSDWRYSLAYDVIGHLISVLAGVPFDAFLRERVFEPLGMEDTGFFVSPEKIDRFAALYGAAEGGGLRLLDAPAISPFLNPGIHSSGGGGLVSTASDVVRFAQMLLNGGKWEGARLLSRKTVELMTTNHLPPGLVPIHFGAYTEPGQGYGLGFGVVVSAAHSGTLGSDGMFGWGGAAGTNFWVDPREELVGLVMPQVIDLEVPLGRIFQNLIYQAMVD
jgi:CubicO group peptidase (beta-lactamase class C family)